MTEEEAAHLRMMESFLDEFLSKAQYYERQRDTFRQAANLQAVEIERFKIEAGRPF